MVATCVHVRAWVCLEVPVNVRLVETAVIDSSNNNEDEHDKYTTTTTITTTIITTTTRIIIIIIIIIIMLKLFVVMVVVAAAAAFVVVVAVMMMMPRTTATGLRAQAADATGQSHRAGWCRDVRVAAREALADARLGRLAPSGVGTCEVPEDSRDGPAQVETAAIARAVHQVPDEASKQVLHQAVVQAVLRGGGGMRDPCRWQCQWWWCCGGAPGALGSPSRAASMPKVWMCIMSWAHAFGLRRVRDGAQYVGCCAWRQSASSAPLVKGCCVCEVRLCLLGTCCWSCICCSYNTCCSPSCTRRTCGCCRCCRGEQQRAGDV